MADARVKLLKANLIAAQAGVRERLDPELSVRLAQARDQLRESRGVKVQGVAPFDAAIREARATLNLAKTAKREFLSGLGLSAPITTSTTASDATDVLPSPRQRLRVLRAQMRENLGAVGGEEVTRIRAELRAAKAERKAECEKAHALREVAREQSAPSPTPDAPQVRLEGGI